MRSLIGSMENRFAISFDRATGIAYVEVFGGSAEENTGFNTAMEHVLSMSRARHGHALALVDLSRSPLMSTAMAEHYQADKHSTVDQRDRIALVLVSTLFKLQLRRLGTSEGTRLFDSYASADAWLHELAAVKASR